MRYRRSRKSLGARRLFDDEGMAVLGLPILDFLLKKAFRCLEGRFEPVKHLLRVIG
jgi:hypothetical protein